MVLYKNFPTCAISKTSKKQDITDMHACMRHYTHNLQLNYFTECILPSDLESS